jgi:hypothetical protein
MVGNLRTPSEAVRHNMVVVAACRPCRREGRFLARDRAQYKGWNASPWKLKFRCSECGGTDMKITYELFDRYSKRL